jgi:hypothetical protein
MGSNLARNLASREGNTVAIFNRSYEEDELVADAHPEAGSSPRSLRGVRRRCRSRAPRSSWSRPAARMR